MSRFQTNREICDQRYFCDGVIETGEPYENVEIRNGDNIPIQLHNWTLRDAASHVFTFPSIDHFIGIKINH